MALRERDPDVYRILQRERERQREGVELIPSENYVSEAVLDAMGTIFTNKYSEGYPGRRYYGGNEHVDEIERLAQERAKALFRVPHANVQPYSGSPANLAVYLAACQPGDPIMGQNLPDGGHLTHGWKVSATGTYYRSIPYHVKSDGYIDFDEVWRLAREHRPRLIWCGATAYVREFPFEKFAEVADEVGEQKPSARQLVTERPADGEVVVQRVAQVVHDALPGHGSANARNRSRSTLA